MRDTGLTNGLRRVHHGHFGNWRQQAEELQGQICGGEGGETLQEELL